MDKKIQGRRVITCAYYFVERRIEQEPSEETKFLNDLSESGGFRSGHTTGATASRSAVSQTAFDCGL